MAPGDIIVKVNLVTSNMWDEMNKAAPFAPLKLKGLICKMIVIEEDSLFCFQKSCLSSLYYILIASIYYTHIIFVYIYSIYFDYIYIACETSRL